MCWDQLVMGDLEDKNPFELKLIDQSQHFLEHYFDIPDGEDKDQGEASHEYQKLLNELYHFQRNAISSRQYFL